MAKEQLPPWLAKKGEPTVDAKGPVGAKCQKGDKGKPAPKGSVPPQFAKKGK